MKPKGISPVRRAIFRVLTATFAILIVATVGEGIARLVFRLPPATFFVEEMRDGERWVTDNPFFGYTFQTPQHARAPAQNLFRARKDADTIRLLILGESAAMGFPNPEFGLARTLVAHLKHQYPEKSFEAIDGTITLINSHLLVEIAREGFRYDPDMVIVYAGNNEFIGPYGPASIFGRPYPMRWLVRIDRWLRVHSVLVRGAGDRFRQYRFRENPRWLGLDHFEETPIQYSDPVVERVAAQFEGNLRQIIRMGERRRIPSIMVTPAVSLRDWPPLHAPEPDLPSQHQSWVEVKERAQAFMRSQRWQRALTEWQTLERLYPDHALVQFYIARCHEGLGQWEEARRHDERACFLDGYRFRASAPLAERIEQLAKSFSNTHLVDARSLLYAQELESGIFLEHVHFSMNGMDALVRVIAPTVTQALGWKDALDAEPSPEDIRDALLFLPDHQALAHQAVQDFLEMQVFRAQSGYMERMATEAERQRAAQAAARELAVDEVLERWERARTIGASPAWTLDYLAGRALYDREEWSQAIKAFDAAIAVKPNQPHAHEWRGFALHAEQDYPAAIASLETALLWSPYLNEALNMLGLCWMKLAEAEPARAAFLRALQVNPRQSSTLNNLGYLELEEGRLDQAVEMFKQSMQENPDGFEPRYHLAMAYMRKDRLPEALRELEAAATLQPNMARIWNMWGLALLQAGEAEEAEGKFGRAVELDPERHDARLQRAFLWLRVQQRAAEAVEELEALLEALPDLAPARFLYGMALIEVGEIDAGLSNMRTATEQEPDQIDWKLQLAQILIKLSEQNPAHLAEARSIAEEVWRESGFQNPAAARLLDMLARRP